MSGVGEQDRELATLLGGLVPAGTRRVAHIGPLPGGLTDVMRSGGVEYILELDPSGAPGASDIGTIDCLVVADLGSLRDPLAVLEEHRRLLVPAGALVCSARNYQYGPVLTEILRGSFRSDVAASGSPTPRLFTYAELVQVLLDASFLPDLAWPKSATGTTEFVEAGAPLFELLDIETGDFGRLSSAQYLVAVARLLPVAEEGEAPLTIVCCVNDERQLDANLLHSPDLREPTKHEILLYRDAASAAEGLNVGIERARNELVVLVHQDVYLPKGWAARLRAQWLHASSDGGPIGLGGVFGIKDRKVPFDAIGRLVHRDRLLQEGSLPAEVDGLDEVVLVVPSATPLRVDPAVGWHLYGTDLALQAHQRGLKVMVLDAPCHHNTSTTRVPLGYRESERALAQKWSDLLPVHTNLSSIGDWLLQESATSDAPTQADAVSVQDSATYSALVRSLRAERAALGFELEKARLQVASMESSPFWKLRKLAVGLRRRLTGR
jgi:hypothetical protein